MPAVEKNPPLPRRGLPASRGPDASLVSRPCASQQGKASPDEQSQIHPRSNNILDELIPPVQPGLELIRCQHNG